MCSSSMHERDAVMSQVLWTDAASGMQTLRHELTIDRGVDFDSAVRHLEHERSADDQSGFRRQTLLTGFTQHSCSCSAAGNNLQPCRHSLTYGLLSDARMYCMTAWASCVCCQM